MSWAAATTAGHRVTVRAPAPAGVPLLEIVSEPDMRSGVEAAAYAAELRRIMVFFGITDGNMQARRPAPQRTRGTRAVPRPSLTARLLCAREEPQRTSQNSR
jgi:hypothetical protein